MSLHRSLTISGDVVVAAVCVVFFTLATLLFILCRKRSKENTAATVSTTINLSIPLGDIDAATDGFHPSRVIGTGRLGTVYKAITGTGDAFAVKRIHPHLVLGNASPSGVAARIRSLSRADHPNVLPILGYSEAPGERVILTDLVSGMRSLEHYLHGGGETLGWRLRLRIAAGASRGVEHLHELGIVHGRLWSANVMIDAGFCARVSDYGVSFLGTDDGGKGGGYWDGEGREECKEADVFGFGVVLLELLSGRGWERGAVVAWAMPLIREGRVAEVLDERVGAPFDVSPLARVAKVAAACVGNGRRSRPDMAHVAAILSDLDVQASVN